MIVWNSAANWLSDLLNAPRLQNISVSYGCDDSRQIWLNRQQLVSQQRIGRDEAGHYRLSRLLTGLDSNQLVIQVMRTKGEWEFFGMFHAGVWSFPSTLEFAAGRSDEERTGLAGGDWQRATPRFRGYSAFEGRAMVQARNLN